MTVSREVPEDSAQVSEVAFTVGLLVQVKVSETTSWGWLGTVMPQSLTSGTTLRAAKRLHIFILLFPQKPL